MDKKHGLFLVFEGCDGMGKTTQAQKLAATLEKQGYPVMITREPGAEEPICKAIREMVLHNKSAIYPTTELFLFLADRAQHVAAVVRPALEAGWVVISDRFIASTHAYQGAGRNHCPAELLDQLNRFASKEIYPDYTFWLDMNIEKALARNADRGDRFQLEDVEFHRRVQMGYLNYFINQRDGTYQRIDASQSIDTVHRTVIEAVHPLLNDAKKQGWLRT